MKQVDLPGAGTGPVPVKVPAGVVIGTPAAAPQGAVVAAPGHVVAMGVPLASGPASTPRVQVRQKSCCSTPVIIMVILVVVGGIVGICVAVLQSNGRFFGGNRPYCTAENTGTPGPAEYRTFDTCQAMAAEFKSGSCGYSNYYGTMGGDMMFAEASADVAGGSSRTSSTPAASSASSGGGDSGFSGTNVQEEGVDELDIVKTDGTYVYAATSTSTNYRPTLTISRAVPAASASVLVRMDLHTTYDMSSVRGLFVKGDRMLVIGSTQFARELNADDVPVAAARRLLSIATDDYYSGRQVGGQQTHSFSAVTVLVFNIATRSNPTLLRRVDIEGNLASSRMVGEEISVITASAPHYYAYDIEPVNSNEDDLLPLVKDSLGKFGIADIVNRVIPGQVPTYGEDAADFVPIGRCGDVGWINTINVDTTITVTMFSLHPGAELLPLRSKTVAGRGYNVYGSLRSVYVASGNFFWSDEKTVVLAFDLVPGDYSAADSSQWSAPGVTFRGLMSVPGTILGQWSMDEGPGQTFRLATHSSEWSDVTDVRGGVNNVYIVNATALPSGAANHDMPIVGSVTGLAPGEAIKATRFMGDRLYMVTFVQTDPLFVIDLADPSQPKVLGELKIPGFSEYLHPVNATHFIGVGQDAAQTSQGWTVTTGMKLSLFDVSDVSKPTEPFNRLIGWRGTYSEALHDSKAVLWDPVRKNMVLPINYYAPKYGTTDRTSYGKFIFQGAMIYHLGGSSFDEVGGVSHNVDHPLFPPPSSFTCGCKWAERVQRSLYIGDVLYTLSSDVLGANSLAAGANLAPLARLSLVGPS